MNLETVFHYVHVIGAMGYAAGAFIALFGLFTLRRSRLIEETRSLLEFLERVGSLSGISLLVTVLAGLYLTATEWGWLTGWIDVSLGSLVLLVFTGAIMGTRRHAITLLVKDMPDGSLPLDLLQRINDPWMGLGVYTMNTVLLGIVFLMTAKPSLVGSLITIGVSLVLGLLISLPNWSLARRAAEKG
jgi:uncharacterized membrane protein